MDNAEIVFSICPIILNIVSVLSMLDACITLLTVHQQMQQDILLCLGTAKENPHVLKAKRKITSRRGRFRSCWQKPGRTERWWSNLWLGELDLQEWNLNLCMSKDDFMKLVQELEPFIKPNFATNWTAVSVEKKVALTLYFLKDTGSIRMTANSFGVATPTVSKTVNEVCRAISKYLGPKYIKLPQSSEEMRELIIRFESKHGFPQAFGCIDGTHIAIQQPLENSHDYFSYKMKYTLNIQAVCDYRGLFLDVDCRWPGSVHDAKVFSNSKINKMLRENKLPSVYRNLVPGHDKVSSLLLADPAYPLLPYCMTEFECCKSNEEVIFNNLLRSSKNQIECAFGRLKARWQKLNTVLNLKNENVPYMIYACFVLHNFCQLHGIHDDDDGVLKQIKYDREVQPDIQQDLIFSCNTAEGTSTRKTVVAFLKEHTEL